MPQIITNETRELVFAVEEATPTNPELAEAYTHQLIEHLTSRCKDPAVKLKYASYGDTNTGLSDYPISSDGFAEAFDVLGEETEMFEHWSRLGIVVGKDVVPKSLCLDAVERIKATVLSLSEGNCDLDNPFSYDKLPVDDEGVPILTRGFFEIYHDDSLAQLRQSVRSFLHHVVLWGRADLWTTFDRFGVKLPGHQESAGLPLHVDQNPFEQQGFQTVQGVLALEDCPEERGTLRAVPGSSSHFSGYETMAPERGEYVELDTTSTLFSVLSEFAQPIPIKQGDLVSWDSRTTHANTANLSSLSRFIALIAAGPNRENDPEAVIVRLEALATGLGSNVRGALMHASKRPRFTDQLRVNQVRQPERLTPLGRLLYGLERYEEN